MTLAQLGSGASVISLALQLKEAFSGRDRERILNAGRACIAYVDRWKELHGYLHDQIDNFTQFSRYLEHPTGAEGPPGGWQVAMNSLTVFRDQLRSRVSDILTTEQGQRVAGAIDSVPRDLAIELQDFSRHVVTTLKRFDELAADIDIDWTTIAAFDAMRHRSVATQVRLGDGTMLDFSAFCQRCFGIEAKLNSALKMADALIHKAIPLLHRVFDEL